MGEAQTDLDEMPTAGGAADIAEISDDFAPEEGSATEGGDRDRRARRTLHPGATTDARNRSRSPPKFPERQRASSSGLATVKQESNPTIVPHKEVKDMVDDHFDDVVDAPTKKAIRQFTSSLVAKIDSLQKTNKRIEKANHEISELNNSRNPPGVRPVGMAFETPLLDSLKIPDSERSYTFSLRENSSIRDAKMQLHFEFQRAQRFLDLKVMEAQRLELKAYLKKQAFIDSHRCET